MTTGACAPPGFLPPVYARNAHVQTLLPQYARKPPPVHFRSERFVFGDGDFTDIDHVPPSDPDADAPLALLLHGLQGSRESSYIKSIEAALHRDGWRVVLMHFRNCSGRPNRLARSYHSGETGDFTAVLAAMQQRYGPPVTAAVGYSLGGNVLLRYLAERGSDAGLDAAVAVSVPYDLMACAEQLNKGFSKLYRAYLLKAMRAALRAKFCRPDAPSAPAAFDLDRALQATTMYGFDDAATAPLHGFDGADHYYASCSSGKVLSQIATPTLLLHAADDPFMTPEVVPRVERLSPCTSLECSARGGHVGFYDGDWWLDRRIPAFLDSLQATYRGTRIPTAA